MLDIVRTRGISVSAAQRQVYVQSMAPQLAVAADSILGNRAAGLYVNEVGQVIVAATSFSAEDRSALSAAVQHLRLRPEEMGMHTVQHSSAQLQQLFAEVSAYLSATSDVGWSGGVDVSNNNVAISPPAEAETDYAEQVRSQFEGQPVVVRMAGPGWRGWT